MIITRGNLYEFYADLWNSAQQTCGNSHYLPALSCWLERSYDNLPKYMISEYENGRIIIYPKFPEFCYQEMKIPEPPKIITIIDRNIGKKSKIKSFLKKLWIYYLR